MFHAKIRNYIHQHRDELFEKLLVARCGNEQKEENFRTNYAILLDELMNSLGITGKIQIENEYSVWNGRIDTLYGNFLIEYKYPTRIADTNTTRNQKFIEQVQRQIEGLAKRTGISSHKVMGAVFDGYYVIYIKRQGTGWEVHEPQKMTAESHEIFLLRLLSVNAAGKALTPDNLIKDFGSSGTLSIQMITMFYHKLEQNQDMNKARLLFEQWQTLYREVCGYSFETKHLKIKNLKEQYGFETDSVHYAYLIFAVQTYFSLVIKILILNILAYIKNTDFAYKFCFHTQTMETLKNDFQHMEEGGTFRKLGISNFLEGDFFSWYLYLWDDDMSFILRLLIEELESYDYSAVILERETARDLLKNLYYELLPAVMRRNLGEFYTPDWLAEFLLDDMHAEIKEDKTYLDPTCGSGTFLVILIKKFIHQLKMTDSSERLLDIITHNVKGYDLNPLAVLCARANYIIALGDLLTEWEKPVEIPVYLCDAMLTVLERHESQEECYILPTKAATFMIPKRLVDLRVIHHVLNLVNACVRREAAGALFEELLTTKFPRLHEQLSQNEYRVLLDFYDKMADLHQKRLDGIWVPVIKNAFAPVFQKKVDYIIGNPPWIDWQNLPENYRDSIQRYWYEYKVFDHRGQKAQLGSAHDDISVLMTYVIMDNFLKDHGKLAFVINQNLLQASGGGEGFRKFQIKEKIPVRVESVNDFVDVEPFKNLGVNNKTATIVLKKNESTRYPVLYKKWSKCVKKIIGANDTKEQIFTNEITCKELYASPVDAYQSSWMISTQAERDIFEILKNKEKTSAYCARKGVDTSANAIFWVKEKKRWNANLVSVDNSPECSRKHISGVFDYPMEREFLFPLLRGKDVKRWEYHTRYSIVLPYTEDGKVIARDKFMSMCPNTYDYFYEGKHGFIPILRERATYRKFILRQNPAAPEYSLYNIGKYTFAPYKVVWKALSDRVAAVTVSREDERMIIPDHNLLMVPLEREMEAYYLTGILNADIVSRFVNAYVAWFLSGHILERIYIPRYCEENAVHNEIARLSEMAHQAVQDKKGLSDLEVRLNKNVNKLLLGTDQML